MENKICEFCNSELEVEKEKRYIVEKVGPFGKRHFDAVDCSICGAQNVIGERLMSVEYVEDIKDNSESEVNKMSRKEIMIFVMILGFSAAGVLSMVKYLVQYIW